MKRISLYKIAYMTIFAALLFTSCKKDDVIEPQINNMNYDWIPVERTTDGIILGSNSEYNL